MSFLFPGFIHQSTPFGPVSTTFLKILFRIRRVIQVRNSHCAMGHCCEPKLASQYIHWPVPGRWQDSEALLSGFRRPGGFIVLGQVGASFGVVPCGSILAAGAGPSSQGSSFISGSLGSVEIFRRLNWRGGELPKRKLMAPVSSIFPQVGARS
jgi:hypothetical protein